MKYRRRETTTLPMSCANSKKNNRDTEKKQRLHHETKTKTTLEENGIKLVILMRILLLLLLVGFRQASFSHCSIHAAAFQYFMQPFGFVYCTKFNKNEINRSYQYVWSAQNDQHFQIGCIITCYSQSAIHKFSTKNLNCLHLYTECTATWLCNRNNTRCDERPVGKMKTKQTATRTSHESKN